MKEQKFIYVVLQGSFIVKDAVSQNPALAQTLNIIFGLIGFILFILGAIVAYDSIKRYREYKKAE